MDGEGWRESSRRKKKSETKATSWKKETQGHSSQQEENGEKIPIYTLDGEDGRVTPAFPQVGYQAQQILVQWLATLLQQAGVEQ